MSFLYFLKKLFGILSAILSFTGVIRAITQKPRAPFIFEFVIFAAFAILLFIPTKNEKKLKAEKNKRKAERLAERLKVSLMTHIYGLPVAEDVNCNVILSDDKITFFAGGVNFELEKNQITDIMLKTDTEIQNQYVSSIGGAAAGFLILGPVGAIIGGRAKKKTIRKNTYYLIITYKSSDSDEIKYICLDANLHISAANYIINDFKSRGIQQTTYKI